MTTILTAFMAMIRSENWLIRLKEVMNHGLQLRYLKRFQRDRWNSPTGSPLES